MDWLDLAQDRDRRWALVIVVINFGFHKMQGIPWPAEDMLASQEGRYST